MKSCVTGFFNLLLMTNKSLEFVPSLRAKLQQDGTEDLETNSSDPQQEQANAIEGKDIADYEPVIDYKTEGSELEIEPVDHVEEELNSDAEYEK